MGAVRELSATAKSAPPDRTFGAGRRTFVTALCIYVTLSTVYFAFAQRERLASHTPYNHYALQAEAWLHGRLDLAGPPPAYTGNNDFARYDGKTYVSFGPVPAALLVPFVALTGSAEATPDGALFVALAGLGPALLYLALERLRRSGRTQRSHAEGVALALLFGLGTVYWFSAEQGTVWFAGHIVAVACLGAYLLAALDGAHPALAGIALGLAVGTRANLLFAAPFFLWELARATGFGRDARCVSPLAARSAWRRLALFALALGAVLGVLAWHNGARFGDPFEFGHRYLDIAWRGRIEKWGLVSPHYLGRNLGVMLAGLPYWSREQGLQVNGHGLALWLTSPFYLYALWPRRVSDAFRAAAVTALAILATDLLYQNSGWIQFGYRFSNDFAPLLFVLLATSGRRLSLPFWLLAALALGVNAFGALTFERRAYAHFYFIDGTQRVIFQPD